MAERYDNVAAGHYAAYRPPLHERILERALGTRARFAVGVDVGCGTGRSTVALAAYCERAVGIDPSPSMLRQAVSDERVSYQLGSGDSIPLPDKTADVITFAGSLHYADLEKARSEVIRVGRPGATVLVYDFELGLDPVLTQVGIDLATPDSDYDHSVNFSNRSGFAEQEVTTEIVDLEMSAADFAHVVLSDSSRLDRLAELNGRASAHGALVRVLDAAAEEVTVPATLYSSSYTLEYV